MARLWKRWKRGAYVGLVGLLLAALVGCGGGQGAAPGGAQTPPAAQQPATAAAPKVLTLATHPVGSLVNSLGTGIATVLGKYLGSEVKVMPTSGPIEWLPMIATGEVNLGVLNNWDAQMGRLGKQDFQAATGGKGAPIYLLTSGTRSMVGTMVADNSGIRSGQDLKGKRVVVTVTGSGGITAQNKAALANFGLTPEDVKAISVPSIEAGLRAVIEGRADATTISLGTAVITELDAEKGARYLSFDPSPEAVQRMQQYYPCYLERVEPAQGRVGVKEPVYLMCYEFYLVGSESLSENQAYQIVKALWEHSPELGEIHARLKDWAPERFVNPRATIPYHPGAVKFYKEVGAWTPEMDALQNQLLAAK
ncbi:MAG: TAXI family TRAP transporter solute-binding subunit [Moorellales bacterium]